MTLPPVLGPRQADEMAQDKTTNFIAQTAHYWLEEKGVYTVPIRSREKRPKSAKWNHLRLVGDAIDKAFRPDDNIGALWGDASDHATDVDLDMDEAIWVAGILLPETFAYGRKGKEYSHYVYRCQGAKTKKWQVPELGSIVEIRSTGSQSVIPPSRHPEGGMYGTDKDTEFVSLTRLDLERLCDEIAVAAIFVHFYPRAGSRHDYVHAITGALCHANWPIEKIKRVMEAVLTCIDDDEEMQDRTTTVVNTVNRHNEGDRTKGFTTLKDWMSMPVITVLRRWTQSGAHEGKITTPPILDDRPVVSTEGKNTDFDTALLEVPGMIGDTAKWARKQMYIDQPVYSLAAGVMCTAVASSNNYIVEAWHTPLQPYLMVTGHTASGKGSVLETITYFARQIGLEDVCFRGFQSWHAMLDILGEEGAACWLWDEAARHMAGIHSKHGQDWTVLTHVISMFGMANKFVPGIPGRRNAIPPLDHPFLTVLFTAQPEALMDAITGTARETGFVNRFLLLDPGDGHAPRNTHRSSVFPKKLKDQARALMSHTPKDGDFTEIKFADMQTFTRFDEFEETCRRRARNDETWGRANQNALILAGLAAIGCDPHRPVITPALASWAFKFVAWSNDCWSDKLRFTATGHSFTEKHAKRIQSILAQPEKYIQQKTNSPNQKLALKNNLVPEAVLKRNTTNIKVHEREQLLGDLLDMELIGTTEAYENVCYFLKTFD